MGKNSLNEVTLKNSYNIPWEAFKCGDEYPTTAPKGQFKANLWQLHDILGNVWEWAQDCYVDSYKAVPTDGSAQEPPDGKACPLRVLRGGSWLDVPRGVRSANRGWNFPDSRTTGIGFRLARTP